LSKALENLSSLPAMFAQIERVKILING